MNSKLVHDIVNGRALVYNVSSTEVIGGLRVSPFGVVSETTKIRAIHYLTFAGKGSRTSVNDDTDLYAASSCVSSHVLRDVCFRVLPLHQKYGTNLRVMLFRIDCEDALR